MLEAEVVGGDHADEDDGEGQDAAGHLEVEAQGGQRGAGARSLFRAEPLPVTTAALSAAEEDEEEAVVLPRAPRRPPGAVPVLRCALR